MALTKPTLAAGAATLLMVACGSSDTTSTSTSTSTSSAASVATPSPSAVATPAATPVPTPTPTAVAALSGTWSGQYSGAYQGTFVLTWQQATSTLSGTIHLSSPPQTLNITGTVQGSTINFGTVGSVGITYTGSVSGASMSGTYKVGGASGGSWSATKTS